MKKLLSTLVCFLFIGLVYAQNDAGPEPTGLRADGKIWVVMAVCVTILIGLFLYVISLDRKISRLEKKQY
jgi:hypothetical protein